MPVFGLSARSRSNLRGVHPDLIKVVERAIQITTEDFRVQEGLRTRERWRRRSLQRHIDEFRIAHVQRSDGWIETMEQHERPGAFAAAEAEEQEGGDPPPLAGAGVVVCLIA